MCAGLSLSVTNVMLGPALAVLVITAWCLPAITIRNFVKIKVYYLQDTETTQHIRVLRVRSFTETTGACGSAFIGVEDGGLRFPAFIGVEDGGLRFPALTYFYLFILPCMVFTEACGI